MRLGTCGLAKKESRSSVSDRLRCGDDMDALSLVALLIAVAVAVPVPVALPVERSDVWADECEVPGP